MATLKTGEIYKTWAVFPINVFQSNNMSSNPKMRFEHLYLPLIYRLIDK